MDNDFIERYRAVAPKLENMGTVEKTQAITKLIHDGALAEKQRRQATVLKSPKFRDKDPATDERVQYWMRFVDEGTMRHYDDLMKILNKVEDMDSIDDIKDYMKQLKTTTMYRIIPGIQDWVDDLESEYYDLKKTRDLSYPVDLMRYQTTVAKGAFESGYRYAFPTRKLPKTPSPSELSPNITSSYK